MFPINDEELIEHNDARIDRIELLESKACAYITAFENFIIFQINCFYCDETFPIKNWANFIQHVQHVHRYCGREDLTKSTAKNDIEIVFSDSDASPAENSLCCAESKFMDLIATENEGNTSPNNVKLDGEALIESKAKSDIQMDKSLVEVSLTVKSKIETSSSVTYKFMDITAADDSDSSFEKVKATNPTPKKLLQTEINVETTDESIVFSFIEELRSYFRLWYSPKNKQASHERTFNKFFLKFMEKHRFEIKRRDMFASIQNLRRWYQEMFANEKFTTLKHPQSEYYKKLAEFLPDKLDGKSCEICKRILPDNLQHYAHKQQEHNENPASYYISGVPKTKIDEYLRARYPITEPLNFECQVCFQKIPARWRLILHIKTHINIKQYVCDICGASFVRPAVFRNHRKRHFGENVIKCNICGKEFNDFTPLTYHRTKYHRPIEGTIEEIENSLKKKFISKRGNTADVFKYKIDPETKRKFLACLFCNKTYSLQPGLSKHLNKCHKDLWLMQKKRSNKNVQS